MVEVATDLAKEKACGVIVRGRDAQGNRPSVERPDVAV